MRMDTLQTWQILLGIGGTSILILIGFFTFLGATLLALVGYFLRNFHNEYKEDKAKTELKEEKLDVRMQRMAETFSDKMQAVVDRIAEKINQLPKGSDGLSQVFLDQERAMSKRIDEHSQRIQNVCTRVEEVAKKVHEIGNQVTPIVLRDQSRERKSNPPTPTPLV